MIVLDTNILSAIMRAEPERVVVAWFDEQPSESIWTTAITVFEIEFGLALQPDSRRRHRLEAAFADAISVDLGGRVLTFDQMAAHAAGQLAAQQRRAGRPVEIRDIQIAGIAKARKATLATRNTRHFDALGIPLLNPWKE